MPTTASIRINGGPAGVADTNLPLGDTVFLSNDTAASTYEWVIVSQPAGDQDDLIPFTTNPIVSEAAAPEFTPTKEGSYLIKLTVNKLLADEATDTTICAVRELLTGDRIPAPQETTEVNEEYGWATAAVTKILQRVTRLSDAGIFVAQNASGGDLSLGKVVHMNGMTTIGTGTNERPIPTVGLALASDAALVDGPLGVVVGDRDGDPYTVADGALCRVMVMGGISSYDLGDTAAAGAPVFVDDLGNLSLTAGTVIRQVGDVAKVVSGTVYDIAISAGANSIPRGNAGGDLDGMYPDPTVAKINGTSVPAAAGAAVGNVLRLTNVASGTEAAEWGPVDLADTDAVTGALPMDKGGTGQALYASVGGIVYGIPASKLDITGPAAAAGYFLTSGAGGTGMPTWTQTVPAQSGGTGIAGGYTVGAMLYANGANLLTSLEPTPAATRGILQSKGVGAAPVWISNGTSGYPLISKGLGTDATFEPLNLVTAVTGTLPVNRGGTGSNTALIAGGVLYSQTSAIAASTPAAAGTGYILCSNASSTDGIPQWIQTLPVIRGGTGQSSGLLTGGVIYAASSSAMASTAPGDTDRVLIGGLGAGPTWSYVPTGAFASASVPIYALQGASLIFTPGSPTYSNATTTFTNLVTGTGTLSAGMVTFHITARDDGSDFYTQMTSATNNHNVRVLLKFLVTGPSGFSKTYQYSYYSAAASAAGQLVGSFSFPVISFLAPTGGSYTFTAQAAVDTNGDSVQVGDYRFYAYQG